MLSYMNGTLDGSLIDALFDQPIISSNSSGPYGLHGAMAEVGVYRGAEDSVAGSHRGLHW